MPGNFEIFFSKDLYEKVFEEIIPNAKNFLWIATANLKNLHINRGKKFRPFLELIHEKITEHVNVRILHSSKPSKSFREELKLFNDDIDYGLELFCCPRNHMKIVLADNEIMYLGSGNITGAGLGLKSNTKRNFELGLITEDPEMIKQVARYFDEIWMGKFCSKCKRKDICPAPIIE